MRMTNQPRSCDSIEVIPGVLWGRPEEIFTPAYWHEQYLCRTEAISGFSHRLGDSFEEEVVACLLGGHGIPAEVGVAAFNRLRDLQLIAPGVEAVKLAGALRQPLRIDNRNVTYRFWAQKSRYIEAALKQLHLVPPSMNSPLQLREYLLGLPGIGPKTASWIVRNWTRSNEVAILDIHIVRAGILMGLYSRDNDVRREYFSMERRFLALSKAMRVPTSDLDSLIWAYMRATPLLVARMLLIGQIPPAVRPTPILSQQA